jgi:hypothetical protein
MVTHSLLLLSHPKMGPKPGVPLLPIKQIAQHQAVFGIK